MPGEPAFGARLIGAGVNAVAQRVNVRSSDRGPGSAGCARSAACALAATTPLASVAIRKMSAGLVWPARADAAAGIYPVVRLRPALLEPRDLSVHTHGQSILGTLSLSRRPA